MLFKLVTWHYLGFQTLMGFFARYEEKYDNVIRETDPNEHPLNLLSYVTVGFSVIYV